MADIYQQHIRDNSLFTLYFGLEMWGRTIIVFLVQYGPLFNVYCDGDYYYSFVTVSAVGKRVTSGVCIYNKVILKRSYTISHFLKIVLVCALYLLRFISRSALFCILTIRSHQ